MLSVVGRDYRLGRVQACICKAYRRGQLLVAGVNCAQLCPMVDLLLQPYFQTRSAHLLAALFSFFFARIFAIVVVTGGIPVSVSSSSRNGAATPERRRMG
jgi:hypothetical protein